MQTPGEACCLLHSCFLFLLGDELIRMLIYRRAEPKHSGSGPLSLRAPPHSQRVPGEPSLQLWLPCCTRGTRRGEDGAAHRPSSPGGRAVHARAGQDTFAGHMPSAVCDLRRREPLGQGSPERQNQQHLSLCLSLARSLAHHLQEVAEAVVRSWSLGWMEQAGRGRGGDAVESVIRGGPGAQVPSPWGLSVSVW